MRSLRYMWAGLLTDRINNKLKKSNLINEHALDREPGLAMPFFIFGDSRLFYWLAAFILIGHILLWLYSLLLQFNRTDVCLLSMTVCVCWHWLYFFFVPWWILWVSNPIRPPLFGCVLNVLCYSFTRHWCRFLATCMVRHLVFSEVRLFVNIMFAWLSYIRDHITDC